VFRNYVKIALRNLLKNKYYSIISICSLGIAISCFIFTYAYFTHETNYDSYYKDNDRIYRIDANTKIYEPVKLACTSELLTRELRKVKSDYENVGAVCFGGEVVFRKDDIMFREKRFYYAEQDFLNIFSTPFLLGNKDNALIRPQTVVLTQSIAQKYFGSSNPVGKEIMISNKNYEVTGVVPDPPTNTHLRYTVLASFATIEPTLEYRDWTHFNNFTYVKLKSTTSVASFNKTIYDLASEYMKGYPDTYLHHELQPVSDVHTNTALMWDIDPHINKLYLYILLAVGILTLVMANINLINMSVSQSLNRSKEIGIRKVSGANKSSIIYQFFVESLIILLFSSILALIFSAFFEPVFNNLTEINFSMSQMLQLNWVLLILLVVFAVSTISCIYPALVISTVNPALVLKKIFSSISRGNRLKTALMTVQYTVTTVLIMCFVVMMAQTKYMKNQYLGFDKERKLVLQIPQTKTDFNYIVKEFSGYQSVSGASISSAAMGGTISFGSIPLPGEKPDSPSRKRVLHFFADDNFIRNYKIDILAGDKERISSDGLKNGIVVNERFVKAFGWKSNQEAVGQSLYIPWFDKKVEVLGVVKNFHHAGLQSSIDPLLIYNDPVRYRYITLNINGDEQGTLSFLRGKWAGLFPEAPFNFFFLDEYFNRNYEKDEKIVTVFSAFSWIGISIACFGLIGVTNNNIQRKIKEAGIRKVFGASIYSLLRVFTNRILLTIIAAGIIAAPIAYYLMDKWLAKYTYRIEISAFYFVASILAIVIISMALILYPLYKAAKRNPIESLRYE
jgi:putative ABC transport system permease protein